MRQNVLLTCASGFAIIGVLLFAAPLLTIGINDAEWHNISYTGQFSKPSALVWTSWHANEDSIQIFPESRRLQVNPPISPRLVLSEARSGRAKGFLFDFTVYEGRGIPGDANSIFAAIGPGWGAHYHFGFAFIALSIASVFLASVFYFRRGPSDNSKPNTLNEHQVPNAVSSLHH